METRCSISLTEVKEVKATTSANEVNKLIKENWILLSMAVSKDNEVLSFSLGKVLL